ncbi:MAG: S1 RNA-binding domain-containing protein [Candidatus Micrarchaeaceae archaeon]
MEKEKLPQLHEIVIGQISKVTQFGAYCRLPEYSNIEVFIPLREVSFGWIKNIHEHLRIGQNVVCKIIYFDRERHTIDASIKQVTSKEEKDKINSYKLEKRLSAMFRQLAKAINPGNVDAISAQAIEEFGTFTNLAKAVMEKSPALEKTQLPKKLLSGIEENIKSIMRKRTFRVSYIIKFLNYNTKSGATQNRNIFSEIEKAGIKLIYISAPTYKAVAEGDSYPAAEAKMKAVEATIKKFKPNAAFSMEKEKLKKENESVFESYFK